MNDPLKQSTASCDPDAVLQEMWDIKDALSASYGHDVHRLFADARKRQAASGRKVVSFIPPRDGAVSENSTAVG